MRARVPDSWLYPRCRTAQEARRAAGALHRSIIVLNWQTAMFSPLGLCSFHCYCDETWIYEFDMQVNKLPTEPKPKKARQSRSKTNGDVDNNFTIRYRGVVHSDLLPEVLLGLFAPTRSVNFENDKSNKRLITLRDYDFVGEDQRLKAVLAARMAILQAPLNLSDVEARLAARSAPPPGAPGPDGAQYFRPGYDDLRREPPGAPGPNGAQRFPPGHDYPRGEPAWAPGPDGAQHLRPGRDHLRRDLGLPQTGNASKPDEALPGPGGRRADWVKPYWHYPGKQIVNKKILDMMRQSIYAAQRKMYEIQGTVSRYERDVRFRMAFIYKRLDEWRNDARTVMYAMNKYRYHRFRASKLMWYYENMLRINIDVTYSIEHLLYLHTMFMQHVNKEEYEENKPHSGKS